MKSYAWLALLQFGVMGGILALFNHCGGDDGVAPSGVDAPDASSLVDAAGLTDADAQPDDDAATNDAGPVVCNSLTDSNCVTIKRGETVYYRLVSDYDAIQYVLYGTERTVIKLSDLVDEEVTSTPDQFRYKIFGTDGYTYGDYLYWEHMLGGYLEVQTRRAFFDPSLGLSSEYSVKNAHLLELLPK